MRVETNEDFGDMMISAVRYGLWRRTYITFVTANYLIPLVKQGAFSKRVLCVMEKDLRQYEEKRGFMVQDFEKYRQQLDGDCDYESWVSLHDAIKEQLKGVNNGTN